MSSLIRDPSRTITLRNRAVVDLNRRIRKIKRQLRETLVENKALTVNVDNLKKEDFVFLRDKDKIEKFDRWLQILLEENLIEGSTVPGDLRLNWLLTYMQEVYEKGARKSNNEILATLGRNEIIASSFLNIPFHVEKMELLFTRNLSQLKGVTEVMSQQISEILARGIYSGKNPNVIAREIYDRVEKIGRTRSRLIARTEIINTHNLAKINEGERLEELLGEEVVYLWLSSGDARVRPQHTFRNKKYYTRSKVLTLIGEPNCRCSVISVPRSKVPSDVNIVKN